MDDAEQKYREELKAQGVELDEPENESEDKPKEEEKDEAKPEPDKGKGEEPKSEPLQTKEPKEQRKRSIYDEYKGKKEELKTERDLRETRDRENEELRQKLAKYEAADTPEEKKEAKDELEQFAEEIKADPAALRKMQALFTKGLTPGVDPELKKDLEDFKQWRTKNSAAIEKQEFEDEFKDAIPKLDKLFPKMTDAERGAVKAELNTLSHKKEWHDKSLGYIAFENQDTLAALVSPKKRGMENRDRKDAIDLDTEFDPNADYGSMTPAQRVVWEEQYKAAVEQEKGIKTDARGKKTLV